MIKGIDVSHWNNYSDIQNASRNGYQFCFIKATEGLTLRDPATTKFIAECDKYGMIKGFYHYAHPELNDALAEAHSFVETLSLYDQIPCLMALDWEGEALKKSTDWAIRWLQEVYSLTTIRPVLYVQSSAVRRMRSVAHRDFGLWVADYSNKKLNTSDWATWAFRQFTNKPYDCNYFNGSIEQLVKYATPLEHYPCQCKCKKCELYLSGDCDGKE